MAIKKVWIDEGCTSCGLCEATCPDVFRVEDMATIIPGANFDENEALIKEAADGCPVEVIKYE